MNSKDESEHVNELLRKCLALRSKYIEGPLNVSCIEVITKADFQMQDGVFQSNLPFPSIPSYEEYVHDMDWAWNQVVNYGPCKTHAFRRLCFLETSMQMHVLLNSDKEQEEQRAVPHRDFYNLRKVDTHVHHSACMNQKHLLRFIKSKLKKSPNDEVIKRYGNVLTLAQVFDSLHLKAHDLSIDTLDMHAHVTAFHRFDRFTAKYNPVGESRLREIFLKTDNWLHGRYLAELTREIFAELEASKYQLAEYRLSIYGKDEEEWSRLAAWVVDNQLFSPNVRWMVQVPRLYGTYREAALIGSFEVMLRNLFDPLFKVSVDPDSNPKLARFLECVSGFDSVDDESRTETNKNFKPGKWTISDNPPYSYYIYYMYANLMRLNQVRLCLGLNTFDLRPHSGEAGDPMHLLPAFLTAQGFELFFRHQPRNPAPKDSRPAIPLLLDPNPYFNEPTKQQCPVSGLRPQSLPRVPAKRTFGNFKYG